MTLREVSASQTSTVPAQSRHIKVWYTLASLKSLCEDASTMFRTWKRLMALSSQRAQPRRPPKAQQLQDYKNIPCNKEEHEH